MLANDSVSFQTEQSKRDFVLTCLAYLPRRRASTLAETAVQYRGRSVSVFVNPMSVDVFDLRRQLVSPGVGLYRAALADSAGLATIVRVDRLDPAKNILGGFQAFDCSWRSIRNGVGRVRFLAFLVPSRDSIPEYQRYRDEVFALIDEINRRYGNATLAADIGLLRAEPAAGARRPQPLRRAPRQLAGRRHEPGREGGPDSQPARRRRHAFERRRAPTRSWARQRSASMPTTSKARRRRCTGRC